MPTLSPAHAGLPDARRWASGIASLDAAIGGGLAYGRIHEIYAADLADVPAAAGFALALGAGMAAPGQTVLWLRVRRGLALGGVLQGNGWNELGAAPARALIGLVPDTLALLRAAVDALRCAALGAVIVEGWGPMHELDLTASRRLALAAQQSGVPLLLLRADAHPVPSAAQTRWQIAAAPSCALPGQAPGQASFAITLLRQRSGPCGQDWQLEWNRDQRTFRETAAPGAVVSVPVRRTAADRGTGVPGAGARAAA